MAFLLNGANLSDTTNLPPIASFTMMGWVKDSSITNAYQAAFAYGSSTTGAYYVVYLDSPAGINKLDVWANGNETAGSSIGTGWNHIALVVDGTGAGNCRTYLNGAIDITVPGDATIPNNQMWVGSDHDLEAANATFMAVKIYDAALTVSEIKYEMHTIAPRRWRNLNRWMPGVNPGLLTSDYSPLRRTWTVSGTPSFVVGTPLPWGITQPPWMFITNVQAAAAQQPYVPYTTVSAIYRM